MDECCNNCADGYGSDHPCPGVCACHDQCSCGSGEPRFELRDGYGIFLTFACMVCEDEKLARYRPDIHERYETDEPIEPQE